ncbi:hypothetical protein [Virgibacillus profundi]|uniref:hypothetical protein n=1 Tax=Virgibacillus profundi TaxID=2024555 RepID=UPI0010559DEB|nr:hypothetical protein [Virgibacillus profundi]
MGALIEWLVAIIKQMIAMIKATYELINRFVALIQCLTPLIDMHFNTPVTSRVDFIFEHLKRRHPRPRVSPCHVLVSYLI